MLLHGCSLAISAEDIEPTDLSSVAVGAPREDVERTLEAPEPQEPEVAGTISLYSYNKGAPGEFFTTDRGYLECWGTFNIFCEAIATPVAMYKRQERYESQLGQVGIHYDSADTVMLAVVTAYDVEADFWELLGRAVCGDTEAQYRIGDAFETGRGVQLNFVESFRWYSIAASGDDPLAARVRDRLAANMTRDEIDQAEELVAAWNPDLDDCAARNALASTLHNLEPYSQETSIAAPGTSQLETGTASADGQSVAFATPDLPPVRSNEEIEIYMKENGERLRRALFEYTRKHNLIPSGSRYGEFRLYSSSVMDAGGDQSVVRIAYSSKTSWNANWREGHFLMQWIDGTLVFVGHA
jgi:hypothetical protein